MNTENSLFKTGYVISLVSIIIDATLSIIGAISILSFGTIDIVLLIFIIIALQIFLIIKYKEKKWAIILLLLVSLLSVLTSEQSSIPLFAITLAVGCIMSLIGAEEN
jgi:hypothetical protein